MSIPQFMYSYPYHPDRGKGGAFLNFEGSHSLTPSLSLDTTLICYSAVQYSKLNYSKFQIRYFSPQKKICHNKNHLYSLIPHLICRQPTDKTIELLTICSAGRSVGQSVSRSVGQSVSRSVSQSVSRSEIWFCQRLFSLRFRDDRSLDRQLGFRSTL